MVLSWWGKGLFQICMHHWTVYAKVEFSRFPPDVRTGGSIPQFLTLKSEMNSKFFQSWRGPFHNFWPWTQKWTLKFFQSWGGSIPQLLILNSEIKVWHWYLLWGFLQYWVHYRHFKFAFSIQKKVKLTFSNGSQLMGKRFMANLHASLDSICKSRISKISTRCQNWEVHSTTFDTELRNEF